MIIWLQMWFCRNRSVAVVSIKHVKKIYSFIRLFHLVGGGGISYIPLVFNCSWFAASLSHTDIQTGDDDDDGFYASLHSTSDGPQDILHLVYRGK